MAAGSGLRKRAALAAAAALACVGVAAAEETRPPPELPATALVGDDECASPAAADTSGSSCSLSALQLHGRRGVASGVADGAEELLEVESADTLMKPTPPPICDVAIVAETCSRVNRLTREYWGTAADADNSVVHAAELAEQLMVSRSSVLQYLRLHIGAINAETDPTAIAGGSFAVACSELCTKTVKAVPSANLPATSDVGCYLPRGASKPTCDVDVSGDVFRHVLFDDHDPEEAASKFAESPTRARSENETDDESKEIQHLLRNSEHPNSTEELRELDVLNYPQRSPKRLETAIANLFRVYPLVDIAVAHADANASAGTPGSALETGSGVLHFGAKWEDEVQKVAVQAQSFTALALRQLNTDKADKEMKHWFGRDDPKSQKEVRRLVNGINDLLSNVAYVYPGKQCHAKTFAYVHPTPPYNKNARGQYVFYLCDTYMSAHIGDKIETLVHEASHHQTMMCEDECFSGSGTSCKRAYGRTTCAKLAQKDPDKALRNADNLAYFVNDMQPNPPRPDCRSYPSCSRSDYCGCPQGKERFTAKAAGGVTCYTCMKALPPGSTRNTGGTCSVFHCRKSRGPTKCVDGKCVCSQGYHAVKGTCKAN